MSVTLTIVGLLVLVASFIGCVLPVLPGPLLAYGGLLLLFATDHPPSVVTVCVATVLVAVACILDYVVPALSAKRFKCTRAGVVGSLVGSVAGVCAGLLVSPLLTVVGGALVCLVFLVLGPFLGTLIGELSAKRTLRDSLAGSVGTLVGFVVATGLKLFVCLVVAGLFLWSWLGA